MYFVWNGRLLQWPQNSISDNRIQADFTSSAMQPTAILAVGCHSTGWMMREIVIALSGPISTFTNLDTASKKDGGLRMMYRFSNMERSSFADMLKKKKRVGEVYPLSEILLPVWTN